MMKVVEEEGTAMDDFVVYLKAEYLDAVYLQQDAFDPVDGATSAERQRHVFARHRAASSAPTCGSRTRTRRARFFQRLTQATRDWNRAAMESEEFAAVEARVDGHARGGGAPCVRSTRRSPQIAGNVITVQRHRRGQPRAGQRRGARLLVAGAGDPPGGRQRHHAGVLGHARHPHRRRGPLPGPASSQTPFSDALLGRIFTGGGVPRDGGPALDEDLIPIVRAAGQPGAAHHPAQR